MSRPAPSPMTKPSRSLSKGREAFSGSSLCAVESAFSAVKPEMPMGVTVASTPPEMQASQRPMTISV